MIYSKKKKKMVKMILLDMVVEYLAKKKVVEWIFN